MSAPVIGSTISHYRVLDELGRGGMGVVYRAVDTRLGREVALKFLPEQVAGDSTALARFRREARAASALNHPNICTIYDVGEDEGRHFIAMELVRGESLAHKLESGPMAPAEVCRIGAQLAGALETAHAQGVIHRDVKPRNVFLTERGDAKLLDFGLAKLAPMAESTASGVTLEAEADVTQEQRIVGTPSYMSPEQVLGRALDGRSDIFSLGSVLYCMATGRRPFEAASVPEVLDSVLRHEPTPVSSVNNEVPAGLARVIARCLAKNPEQRYPDARELRRDLERLARGESPSHTPNVAGRRRLALVLSVMAVMALLVVAFIVLRGDGEGRTATATSSPIIAVLPFSNQTGDPAKEYLGPALAAGLLTELGEISALRLVSAGVLGADRAQAAQRALELGTELFVEGEVQEISTGLRVHARITDSRRGLVLWSDSADAGGVEELALPARLARSVATFLAIPLSPRERRRLDRDPTSSLDAWRLYAEGVRSMEEMVSSKGFDHAIEALSEATRLDPDFALAHAALGRALWMQHDQTRDPAKLEAAAREAQRAVQLDPELPEARLTQALVLYAPGGGDEASRNVAGVLARHPHPAAARSDLAFLQERFGRDDEAERLLREAVAIDGEDWFNWNRLGVFLFRKGKLVEARQVLERASERAPSGVTRPRENLAVLALQELRFDDAFRILDSLPDSTADGGFADTMATAFFFSNREDKWEKAEHYYRIAIERAPSRAEYRGNLADLYRKLGRTDEALELYRQALALVDAKAGANPQDVDAALLAALYAAKADDCGSALPRAAALGDLVRSSAQRAHQLGLVYSLCRDRSATLRELRRAVELGYPAPFIAQEDEFGWLAGDPELTSIVAAETAP